MTDMEPAVEASAEIDEPERRWREWTMGAKARVKAAPRRSGRFLAGLVLREAPESDAAPEPESTPTVPAEEPGIRAQLADARIAARRTLERLIWARVIIAAVVNFVIGYLIVRFKVWRRFRK